MSPNTGRLNSHLRGQLDLGNQTGQIDAAICLRLISSVFVPFGLLALLRRERGVIQF
jgi:hypothetical protein